MRRLIGFVVLFYAFTYASHASAALTYTFAETYAKVHDGSDDNIDSQPNTSGALAVAMLPGYTCTTVSTLGSTTLTGNFVQSRANAINGFSYSSVEARFTIDSDMSYNAAGLYTNSDGYTQLVSWLRDLTTDTYLYQSNQEKQSGPVTFTVGSAEGYEFSAFIGSLVGSLIGGHSYQWVGQGLTEARLGGDNGATANGSVSLQLGVVPEPSTFSLFALATFAGLMRLRRAGV